MSERPCRACHRHLPRDAFPKVGRTCKKCVTARAAKWRKDNPERYKEYRREWNARDTVRAKHRVRKLQYLYGLTIAEYEAMYAEQFAKCAICVEPFTTTPHVDHCHVTGKVRGLLCDLCNRGIGYFSDDPLRLEAAAAYLRKA